MNWNDIPTIKDWYPKHNAKFTRDQIRYIREKIAQGAKLDALAYEFGVTHSTISNIKHKHTYRRVL